MSIKPADRSLRRYARRIAQHASPRREREVPWPRTWAEREAHEAGEQGKADHAARQLEQQAAPILRTCWHHGARVTRPE